MERNFDKAEERKDVEEMHRLWCKAAVQTLRITTNTVGVRKYKNAEKRAKVAEMAPKKIQCQY